MEAYFNQFHSSHVYLKITDHDVGAVSASTFIELRAKYHMPLQVMVSSDAEKVIGLLLCSGFVLKRRCYEMDVGPSDLLSPLPKTTERLHIAAKGSPAYASCAAMLYAYYQDAHAAVNPLTATPEAFVEKLPDTALYTDTAAAFVEGNEIAYLCASSRDAFPAFAAALLSHMFAGHDRLVFEADDTDWAATELRGMFRPGAETTFTTYVMP